MTDKEAVASKVLRSLHKFFMEKLSPEIADEFYSESLITHSEKEEIEEQKSSHKKVNCLLECLWRRDEVKVVETMIKLLEGEHGENKELNALILRKIESVYPFYSFKTNEAIVSTAQNETQPASQTGIPTAPMGQIPMPLPPLTRGGNENVPSSVRDDYTSQNGTADNDHDRTQQHGIQETDNGTGAKGGVASPDLCTVYSLLKEISHHWNEIGRELNVDYDFRENLRTDLTGSAPDKLEAILNRWIEYDSRDPWLSLYNAMVSLHHQHIAAEIYHKYLQQGR